MRHRRAVHSSSSNRLTALGLLAAPVLTLALGITLNSSSPQIARASNPLDTTGESELRSLPDRPLPPALRERIQTIAQSDIPNPLYYPPQRLDEPALEPDPVPLEPAPVEELRLPVPGEVTAILRGRDRSVRALIDGILYQAGDELAPDWRIVSIDPSRRLVTLLQPDGKLRTIQMQKN